MTSIILTMSTLTESQLEINSPTFRHQGRLPVKYTCDGEGVNPPLEVKHIPKGAQSLALIMDDPDAPNGTYDHWLVWDIPVQELIAEDSAPGIEGKNSSGAVGYIGPCPPKGAHRYFFTVYALDKKLELKAGADKIALLHAMKGHVMARGEIVAVYQRRQ